LFSATVTVALNWAVREVNTVTVVGLTLTVIVGGVTVMELVGPAAAGAVPPHDVIKPTRAAEKRRIRPIPDSRRFISRPQNPEM